MRRFQDDRSQDPRYGWSLSHKSKEGLVLVLSRKPMECLHLDGNVVITLLVIRGNRVRLGVEAPAGIVIERRELTDVAIANQKAALE
ncbi:MAG TPA: carbon storage regulator [Planctomycetaceae bacterium]|nr:carbon storage regulator [Planctomycetaceae bacterium]